MHGAGKGTVVYKNGDKYEGDWSNDLRHGLGTLWIYRKGKYIVRYNGEWRDDQPVVSAGLNAVNGLHGLCKGMLQSIIFEQALLCLLLFRATAHFLKTMATLTKATG